jgi:Zn-dependent protease
MQSEGITSMQLTDAFTSGIAAMILHEWAHVAAALALKVKIYQVGINWRGPYVRRNAGGPTQNLAITLSGPGINLLLAMMLLRTSPNFALCNLVIGVSNLLPIRASDGSRALHIIRESLTRYYRAQQSN